MNNDKVIKMIQTGIFEEKYFHETYRHNSDGTTTKLLKNIERINADLEDITSDDVVFMSNAILRTIGHFGYANAIQSDPRDGGFPDHMFSTYSNLPKNTLTIKGLTKNYEFHDYIKKILKEKSDLYQILEGIQSMIYKPLPFTKIMIFNQKNVFQIENKMSFEYFYEKDKGLTIKTFDKGPWIDNLKEIYNSVVDMHMIKHGSKEPYSLLFNYWSDPKYIPGDEECRW